MIVELDPKVIEKYPFAWDWQNAHNTLKGRPLRRFLRERQSQGVHMQRFAANDARKEQLAAKLRRARLGK